MRIGLVAASAAAFAALATLAPAQQVSPRVYAVRQTGAPQVDLWLDQISYRPGDRIAPHFVTEPGAYVTIVRVTSDGELAVLYPRHPRDQIPYHAGQLVNDRVPLYLSSENRFQVYESRGIGFVFAIASFDRFNYSYFTQGDDWSQVRLTNDGRYGDPFEIVRRFVDRTLSGNSDYSLDYVSYDVSGGGARSRYASRYRYNSIDDFYDSCLNAFGLPYSSYCYNSYPGYFRPIIVSRPGNPAPSLPSSGRNLSGKKINPVSGDPMVAGAPSVPEVATEGRLPNNDAAEAAAWASQAARMRRDVIPVDRVPTQVDTRPVYVAPVQRTDPVQHIEPEPRQFERPVMRAEPFVERPRVEQPVYRAEPRVEQQRAEPRPQADAQPRVEVRNEPVHQAPQQSSQPAPRATGTPATKDQN